MNTNLGDKTDLKSVLASFGDTDQFSVSPDEAVLGGWQRASHHHYWDKIWGFGSC